MSEQPRHNDQPTKHSTACMQLNKSEKNNRTNTGEFGNPHVPLLRPLSFGGPMKKKNKLKL